MSKSQKKKKKKKKIKYLILPETFFRTNWGNSSERNEIFGKDVIYDNIKSHRKTGFYPPVKDTFLEKPQKEKQLLIPLPPAA